MGDWRGYSTVGTVAGQQTQTKALYFRGLDEDRTDSGYTARVASVTNSLGETVSDEAAYAGIVFEAQTLDGPGGQVLSKKITNPWRYLTGSRNMTNSWAIPPTQSSYLTRTARERSLTWLPESGTWRTAEVATTWDSARGAIEQVEDKGDVAVPDDDTCTQYFYLQANPTEHLLSYPNDIYTYAVGCASAGTEDPVTQKTIYYDNQLLFGAINYGNPTKITYLKTLECKPAPNGCIPFRQDIETLFSYDVWGRVTSATDAIGRTTTTTYTHNSAGLLSQTAVTTPAPITGGTGHTTTTTFDGYRGVPDTVTDPNGKVTDLDYDPLGRLVEVWKPGNTTIPAAAYEYTVQATASSYVRTRLLGPNGNQIDSYEIYDGSLRLRQTQTPDPNQGEPGRVIATTSYDGRGLAVKTSSFYNNASAPTSALETPINDADVARQQRFLYDGAGRQTAQQLWTFNAMQWETQTIYGGDRTGVIPPAGGTPTQDLFDARGRTTAKRQYHGTGLSGGFDETTYGYDWAGRLTTVTDPVGNTWSYSYNRLGDMTLMVDPDSGTTGFSYDDAGQLVSSTDARGVTLRYANDNLGRRTAVHEGDLTGPKRAEWVYDTLAKGRLTSSTRYDNGLAYTTTIGGYDDGYRPTSTTVTVPDDGTTAGGLLAGTYTTGYTYRDNGQPDEVALPAMGLLSIG